MSAKPTNNKLMCPIDVPGLDKDAVEEIERIISEFESKHEQNALTDGDGWVPRMKPYHYWCAIVPNACFAVWLLLAYIF